MHRHTEDPDALCSIAQVLSVWLKPELCLPCTYDKSLSDKGFTHIMWFVDFYRYRWLLQETLTSVWSFPCRELIWIWLRENSVTCVSSCSRKHFPGESLSYLNYLFICHFQLRKQLLGMKFLSTQLTSINQKREREKKAKLFKNQENRIFISEIHVHVLNKNICVQNKVVY